MGENHSALIVGGDLYSGAELLHPAQKVQTCDRKFRFLRNLSLPPVNRLHRWVSTEIRQRRLFAASMQRLKNVYHS